MSNEKGDEDYLRDAGWRRHCDKPWCGSWIDPLGIEPVELLDDELSVCIQRGRDAAVAGARESHASIADGAIRLFGHLDGATVAQAIAQAIRDQGKR